MRTVWFSEGGRGDGMGRGGGPRRGESAIRVAQWENAHRKLVQNIAQRYAARTCCIVQIFTTYCPAILSTYFRGQYTMYWPRIDFEYAVHLILLS